MKKGFTTWAILIIIALVLIGAIYFLSRPDSNVGNIEDEIIDENPQILLEEESAVVEEGGGEMGDSESSINSVGGEGESQNVAASYSGEVLAGNKSLLLDFNNAGYQKALSEKDIVLLYFFANWCPICQAEFPKAEAAFNKLQASNVIGFRVNYNDNQTDASEKELAKEFGVAYQHTKIILKNGERVLKSPETWEEDRYISEINNLLN